MIELEKKFLARKLPEGLEGAKCEEMVDIYIPKEARHAYLRVRKRGERMVITKKKVKVPGDYSVFVESTIVLEPEEYGALAQVSGRRIAKKRYYLKIEGVDAQVDVFEEDLSGLVIIEFEFKDAEEKENFAIPDVCLCEATGKEFLAGGHLCGKSYSDIEEDLNGLGYKKI